MSYTVREFRIFDDGSKSIESHLIGRYKYKWFASLIAFKHNHSTNRLYPNNYTYEVQ